LVEWRWIFQILERRLTKEDIRFYAQVEEKHELKGVKIALERETKKRFASSSGRKKREKP